ncbi:F-box only protein 41 isoform X2 [Pristis pectinata]|uniref:F-box only protein 41 isoform X2 n=1 Tax=Pristis pectinata TaxID=685728 RepID=UPI00223DC495|nr:F-box only protein 41 isoform X2 [Pristis pectinata]
MASLDLPYRCPRCGEHKRFRSLSSLRAHLEYNHTYETLYVLSKSNSICDASILSSGVDKSILIPASCKEIFESTSFRSKEQRYLYDLECGEELSLGSACYLPEVEGPVNEILMRKAMTPSTPPAALAAAAVDAVYEEGLARLKIQAFEKLDLNERLEKLSEEVEQKITARVDKLQIELEKKSSELEKAKQESMRLSQEKHDLEEKASELSRQVDVSVEMLATLKQDLVQKDQELARKQQEVLQIDQFLQETAAREANAKVRLQQFIEELLDRADRAEKQLMVISSCGTTPNGSLGRCSNPGAKGMSRQQGERYATPTGISRGTVLVSEQQSLPNVRPKPLAHVSRCYDSDSFMQSVDMQHIEQGPERNYHHKQIRNSDSKYMRDPMSRNSALRRQAVENWHRRPYRNSTEGEEGDVSDAGSRTTESEVEVWEQESKGSTEPQKFGSNRARAYRLSTSNAKSVSYKTAKHQKGSPSRSNEVISPEVLKMRAALFCIFTYLDTKTLLQTAEVCRDWKYVARHPAVWTRVLLENARVSSKFMVTLSQWCTQTHSLTLQSIKPRPKGKKETKEEYLKSTHGCLETGLESLLKAAGSNLLILKVSHCPNILTDRSLWLASCYCRALQAVTYRSSTDPVGHEVIWALGAGCRDIISLQVAPLHPCHQPTRFNNRSLQMIGRCWPHLRALGVGGAGCGLQGLASLARNCIRLQVLELDHVTEINQEVAAEVCREGLKGLEMLVLTSTPVTPKALLHFNSVCRSLKSIVVHIGITDYFEEPGSPEARKLFEEMVSKLQVPHR